MDSLALLDAIFLFLETPENPKHVGALLVFDAAPDAGAGFVAQLAGRLRGLPAARPFNQRVQFHATGMPTWEALPECDLAYHVRHVVLPAPADEQALLDHVARLHEPLLDRDMPLWEFHLIEGLEHDRFAVYTKIHHACVDGLSGVARIQATLHDDPEDRELRAPWGELERAAKPRHAHSESWLAQLRESAGALRDHLQAGAQLTAAALQGAIEMTGLVRGQHYLPFSAPRTALNRPVHRSRAIGVATLELDRVHSVAHRAGSTVNDVVLSVIDDAIHRYLRDHAVETGEPLVAMVPMSLREKGDTSANTQACLLYIELGSEHASPRDRLEQVHRSSARAKKDARAYSPVALADHSMLMIGLAELVGRLTMGETARPPGNVLVSNVPGSDRELFLHGARLRAAYPMSTLMPGCALNVTLLRHGNQLDFGLVASRETIPDVRALAACVQSAFQDLERE